MKNGTDLQMLIFRSINLSSLTRFLCLTLQDLMLFFFFLSMPFHYYLLPIVEKNSLLQSYDSIARGCKELLTKKLLKILVSKKVQSGLKFTIYSKPPFSLHF